MAKEKTKPPAAEPAPKGPVPNYCAWLNNWSDLQRQIETRQHDQITLCDKIAGDTGMGLASGETRTITYLGYGYEVTGIERYDEAGAVIHTCSVKEKVVDEFH